jgi:alpha-1,3-rhamnosyl/mannosyltransferase
MASHAAILTSNNSSLGELFKDVAVTVDPYSIDDIAQGIDSLLDEEKRKALAQKGNAFSKSFSWEKSAKEHLEVFHSLL